MTSEAENEIWIPIFRAYEISNMGRVRSSKYGYWRVLKHSKNNRGYHQVSFRIAGKHLRKTIHRLVGIIFVDNIDPNRNTVNHNFGDKDDNRAQSLSWMSYSENSCHGVTHGLIASGSQNYSADLDDTQVLVIRSLKGEFTQQALADYFQVDRRTIGRVLRGRTYKNVA